MRYLVLDMAAGIATNMSVSLDTVYRHCEGWVEAFAPAYQGDPERRTNAAYAWWDIHRNRTDLLPRLEWPVNIQQKPIPTANLDAMRRELDPTYP